MAPKQKRFILNMAPTEADLLALEQCRDMVDHARVNGSLPGAATPKATASDGIRAALHLTSAIHRGEIVSMRAETHEKLVRGEAGRIATDQISKALPAIVDMLEQGIPVDAMGFRQRTDGVIVLEVERWAEDASPRAAAPIAEADDHELLPSM